MSKKYFFFDIDGTLLSETDKKMPVSCTKTLAALKKRGHFVAIATSRPYILTYEEAQSFHIHHFVCDGGDGLVINDQIIQILPLNLSDAKELVKETVKYQLPIAVSIDTTNNRYSPDDAFINNYPYLQEAFDFVTLPDFDALKAQAIHKMCILCTREQEKLLPSLTKVPHYRLDEQCILVEATDKYKGIIQMMKYLHAPLEDVVVFGDGTNDLSMFKQAPCSIAMGNAVADLKAIASYITENASQDGIEKACRHFGWI